MLPFPGFPGKSDVFWANVRFLSESLGYTEKKMPKRYSPDEILGCLKESSLCTTDYIDQELKQTQLFKDILDYLNKRSVALSSSIEPNLMDRERARVEFEKLMSSYTPKCKLPLNKQKNEKKHHAYLTGIINMLTEKTLDGCGFDDDPRGLTVVTKNKSVVRTLSRWMDGAYPSMINPIAIWEVKEYYGTTTFGSRVADGVYETMLDGMELRELNRDHGIRINHYLIIDDRFTWWDCGKSYLCRIVDMLNMGLVDEVIVGKEVITRWPQIVRSWTEATTSGVICHERPLR